MNGAFSSLKYFNGKICRPLLRGSILAMAFVVMAGAPLSWATVPVPPTDAGQSTSALAGHKAVYNIQLAATKMGSPVIGLRGKLTNVMKPTCDGWIVDHLFRLNYDYASNPATEVETKFTSFEAYDGKEFQFSSTRRTNGEISDELRGRAALTSGAIYTIPDKLTYSFQNGTLFPTTHTAQLVAAALAGKKVFNAVVFDGSDDAGPVEMNAFIGKQFTVDVPAQKSMNKDLISVAAWPIRMAVFPYQSEQPDADYEMNMTLLQNGIIKDMTVEYHDFSVTQKLISLDKMTAEKCGE